MDPFVPSRAFQVLYDFEGTNERELTISSGEILLSQDVADKSNEGDWIYVVKLKEPTKRGFVPSGFIVELSAGEASRYISAWNIESASQIRSSTPSGSPGISRMASSSLSFPSSSARSYPSNFSEQQQQSQQNIPQHPQNPSPQNPPTTPYSTNPASLSMSALNYPRTASPAAQRSLDDKFASKRPTTPTRASPVFSQSSKITPPSASGTSASVMEMFAKHEAYLRQVMRQREDKFKELEKAITSTGKDIEKYKVLNDTLFQKILKLESALDTEHNKLKQKILEEERPPAFGHQ